MRIIEEVKLDFSDVLIKPKEVYSDLTKDGVQLSENSNSDIQIKIGKVFQLLVQYGSYRDIEYVHGVDSIWNVDCTCVNLLDGQVILNTEISSKQLV